MLVEAAVGLLLAVSNNASAAQLSPNAACALAKSAKAPTSKVYSIRGTYKSEHHGSIIELPECDSVIAPELGEEVRARLQAYHWAFSQKCGATLAGDWIEGVFTGKFERKKWTMHSMAPPAEQDVFVVSAVEASALDPASISCPKL